MNSTNATHQERIFHSAFGHFHILIAKSPDVVPSETKVQNRPIPRSHSFIVLIGKDSSPEIARVPQPIGFCSEAEEDGEANKASAGPDEMDKDAAGAAL